MRRTRNNTHQPVFDASFHDHEIEKGSDHMPALTTPHDGHFLEIGQKCEEMIKDAYIILKQFPRVERHVLGAEIRQSMWSLLRLITRAGRRFHKKTTLEDMAIEIDMLRSQVRVAKQLGYIATDKYRNWAVKNDEIGRKIGAWLRHESGNKPSIHKQDAQ